MKALLRIAAVLLLFTSALAYSDTQSVKHLFSARFPGAAVESVTPTPFKGLYEVYVNGNIYYTDESVNYAIQGNLIDAKARRSLTEERLNKLSAVPFDQLPLDLAIKIVKGNGKRKVAIFEDPDCPFCRKLEQEMVKVTDVTFYVFLYPIEQLHPGATEKSKKIWCSPDRGKTWQEAVQKGINPNAAATCDNPVERIAKLGRTYRVTGTPTLFFVDGTRVPGAISAEQLESMLNAATKSAEAGTGK